MKRSYVAFASLMLFAMPAGAQDWDAGAAVDMTGMGIYAMEDAVMEAAREGSGASGNNAAVPRASQSRTPADAAGFRFTPSAETRRAVQAQMVSKTREVDAAQATQLEQLFASQDLIAGMTPPLRALGLSTNDVADAYTAYWIMAWSAVNGQAAEPTTTQVAAVRQQAARAMEQLGVEGIPDSAKQEIAESCLIQGALMESAIAHAASDPAALQQVAAAARQGATRFGLDLDQMTLTDQGFVKR
ncbi:hypothetical protein GRI97_01725 [Altererythrobacter xixiisoli]|uniref:Uncharacterized protein n=1 Tax=Croceibacterium xixiisoli TaxID=1476466 RepID=A0A6I4TPI4_9SPHN|nr:DUF6683 family protein [Croceibacterium xixiisoli]MXO97706.1 hypothetical protein [Croceibacterium xixiisoli]